MYRNKRHLSILFSLFAIPGLLACGDDGHDHDHGADAALQDQAVTLQFAGKVGAEVFSCSDAADAKVYAGLGTQASSVTFKDYRFYVSNFRLIDDGGNEVPMTLDTASAYQLQTATDHVALLDFEDGTASCSDTGNAETNTTVTGTVPAGTYTGVVFELGVPFAINHADVATADAPLNIGALYWAWAIGHKFARIDYVVDGTPWNFHLGSTMCVSDGMDSPPSEECGRPNRATVRFDNFDVATETIVFDAAAVVADSDITQNMGMPTPGCMTFPHDEPDCTALFPNLGLTYTTGACTTDCSDQTVFTVE